MCDASVSRSELFTRLSCDKISEKTGADILQYYRKSSHILKILKEIGGAKHARSLANATTLFSQAESPQPNTNDFDAKIEELKSKIDQVELTRRQHSADHKEQVSRANKMLTLYEEQLQTERCKYSRLLWFNGDVRLEEEVLCGDGRVLRAAVGSKLSCHVHLPLDSESACTTADRLWQMAGT